MGGPQEAVAVLRQQFIKDFHTQRVHRRDAVGPVCADAGHAADQRAARSPAESEEEFDPVDHPPPRGQPIRRRYEGGVLIASDGPDELRSSRDDDGVGLLLGTRSRSHRHALTVDGFWELAFGRLPQPLLQPLEGRLIRPADERSRPPFPSGVAVVEVNRNAGFVGFAGFAAELEAEGELAIGVAAIIKVDVSGLLVAGHLPHRGQANTLAHPVDPPTAQLADPSHRLRQSNGVNGLRQQPPQGGRVDQRLPDGVDRFLENERARDSGSGVGSGHSRSIRVPCVSHPVSHPVSHSALRRSGNGGRP